MTPPATRGKNKRNRPGDIANITSEILRYSILLLMEIVCYVYCFDFDFYCFFA